MCGIAGFIGIDAGRDSNVDTISRMMAAISYRGPDEAGLVVGQDLALCNVRLSIIDLKNGQQPMRSACERYHIAFNGEIFNYLELQQELERHGIELRTCSDTEVLLQALILWGTDALPRLNGQFAFAFRDHREETLLIARDRYGERPLFYHHDDKMLVFASEIKSILANKHVRSRLDPAAVSTAYRHWTNRPQQTCFEAIASLAPGSYCVWNDGALETGYYYDLPLGQPDIAISEEDACRGVRDKLQHAVALRLRADVPVGVYLSGGLDSTLTTALACRRSTSTVRSYAVEFVDNQYDESDFQRLAVDMYKTEHHAVRVSDRDIVEHFPNVVRHSETVQFRSAAVPMYLLSRAVRQDGIKVVLTGEGADEAFLGYDIFKETLLRSEFKNLSGDERRAKISGLYPYLPLFSSDYVNHLSTYYENNSAGEDRPLYSHEPRFRMGEFAQRLLRNRGADTAPLLENDIVQRYPDFSSWPLHKRAQMLEYASLLACYLLSSQGDRMTAAHGVEGRSPFLDHELVDYALSLPLDLRLKQGKIEKYILKSAFSDLLPDAIVERPKQPYRAPDSRSFLANFETSWVGDALSDSALKASELVDPNLASRFVLRLRSKAETEIAPREDQAFMLLLSTLQLENTALEFSAQSMAPEERDLAIFELI